MSCVYKNYGGQAQKLIHTTSYSTSPIRMMTFLDGVAYLQAGGGIVFDSVEEDEYIETINKLGANVRTIDRAEGAFLCRRLTYDCLTRCGLRILWEAVCVKLWWIRDIIHGAHSCRRRGRNVKRIGLDTIEWFYSSVHCLRCSFQRACS